MVALGGFIPRLQRFKGCSPEWHLLKLFLDDLLPLGLSFFTTRSFQSLEDTKRAPPFTKAAFGGGKERKAFGFSYGKPRRRFRSASSASVEASSRMYSLPVLPSTRCFTSRRKELSSDVKRFVFFVTRSQRKRGERHQRHAVSFVPFVVK